jgi:hypothetical protein
LVGEWKNCAVMPDQGCENKYRFSADHRLSFEHGKMEGSGESSGYAVVTTKNGSWKIEDNQLVLSFSEMISKEGHKAIVPPEIRRYPFRMEDDTDSAHRAFMGEESRGRLRLDQTYWGPPRG